MHTQTYKKKKQSPALKTHSVETIHVSAKHLAILAN